MSLVVRTAVDPASMDEAVRRAVLEIDPNQPVYLVRTMEEVISGFLSGRRFNTLLFGLFAALALVLALAGVYGVLSYSVSQRTSEIGLRMALGACRANVLRLVLRQGLLLTAAGAVVGIGAAVGLTRFLESQLYSVEPTDPSIFAAVTVLLFGIALAACILPARRAARVEPVVALRQE